MNVNDTLALINGSINAVVGIVIFDGWRKIKNGRQVEAHRTRMGGAIFLSAVFLSIYLTRMALFGDKHYAGPDALRIPFFALLISHIVLALVVTPMVLRSAWLARKERFAEHKNIARKTFPIWLYVCITGVLVYLGLYQL